MERLNLNTHPTDQEVVDVLVDASIVYAFIEDLRGRELFLDSIVTEGMRMREVLQEDK